MHNAQCRNMHMLPIKFNPCIYFIARDELTIHAYSAHITKFDMDFGLLITSNLISYIFPAIPIERLVGGSLRCSQDNLERL
jgi:hypothetical protein